MKLRFITRILKFLNGDIGMFDDCDGDCEDCANTRERYIKEEFSIESINQEMLEEYASVDEDWNEDVEYFHNQEMEKINKA